jgi:two-component system response regulator RpfG
MIDELKLDSISVMIVDDQMTSRLILSKIIRDLSTSIKITEFSNPEEALAWSLTNTADLIVIDYEMPQMNGVQFAKELKKNPQYASVPTLMVTVATNIETRFDALNVGITDFLTKPFNLHECQARCRNLITLRQQHLFLEDRTRLLEVMVRKGTNNVLLREKETLIRLARAGEFKDIDTSNHLVRMSLYSSLLAKVIGMSEADAEVVELASPLHDLGKIGIPDNILLKQGPLNESELAVMRTHPQIGYEILKDSPSIYLQMGANIALAHHEKYDGSGYPFGKAKDEIPLEARIVGIADVFDALTTERPYKKAWSFDATISYLLANKGSHFDPELVDAMVGNKELLLEIQAQYSTNL